MISHSHAHARQAASAHSSNRKPDLSAVFAVVHDAWGHISGTQTKRKRVACRKLNEAVAERDSWPITVSKAEDVQFVKELVDEVSGWLQARPFCATHL